MKAKIDGWDCDASFPESGVFAARKTRFHEDLSVELKPNGDLTVKIEEHPPWDGYRASVTIPAAMLEWLENARKEAGK